MTTAQIEQSELRDAAEAMLAALVVNAEGVNTAIDNWDHWTPKQIKSHLGQLQYVAAQAIAAAEAAGIKAS